MLGEASGDEQHLDVLIVGAGLSGIDAACRLRERHPARSVAILEARDAIGGTWDLFRYPGVRSDSDMHTLGFPFRPWADRRVIADGDRIRDYIVETARVRGIDRRIRFGHRVVSASWSTADARWTVEVERTHGGGTVTLTCGFLYLCPGYYRYDHGHEPAFPDVGRFRGPVVHPQHWPDDLDVAGRRVTVVGSGATAVTLVPALAERGAHVTMLQRSPGYVLSVPSTDPVADALRRRLPSTLAAHLVRAKNLGVATLLYQLSQRLPDRTRGWLQGFAAARLPEGFDVATHFSPDYDPWDQRLCLVPDGDLFRELREGRADIVTGHIATFTPDGLELTDGRMVDADVVVTATGLELQVAGGVTLHVDGRAVDPAATVTYKGVMLTGVPNLALALGYVNASWTLKVDLTSRWVCRLLAHMDRHGHRIAVARPPDDQRREPLIPLSSGYIRRSLHQLPQQGPRSPWRMHQNYLRDLVELRLRPVADHLAFPPTRSPERRVPTAASSDSDTAA